MTPLYENKLKSPFHEKQHTSSDISAPPNETLQQARYQVALDRKPELLACADCLWRQLQHLVVKIVCGLVTRDAVTNLMSPIGKQASNLNCAS